MTLLEVIWSERESATYYVDTKGAEVKEYEDCFEMRNFCGTYVFNKDDKSIFLNDGVVIKPITILSWKVIRT